MKKVVGTFKGVMTLFAVSVLIAPIVASAATAPDLGTSSSYSVFGKAGVTNDSAVGTTNVWGNVGADLLASITNINDATQVSGSIVAPAAGVQSAASAAYDALNSEAITAPLDLAGTNTVAPGVYNVGATGLNGTLTLDGAGVYIFRSDSSVTTSGGGSMRLINGATACNVFWQIPTSMTIGAGSHIEGTIIAQTGLVSMAAGATLTGRALSITKQVTLDSNQINEAVCAVPVIAPIETPVIVPVVTPIETPVIIPVVTSATPVAISEVATVTPVIMLPSAGFPEATSNTPWGVIALSSAFILLSVSALFTIKKRA